MAATAHSRKFASWGSREVGERHFPRMPFMWTQSCHFPGNSVKQGLGAISQSTIAVHVASFREHITERQKHNYSQKGRPRLAFLFSSQPSRLARRTVLCQVGSCRLQALALALTPGTQATFSAKGSLLIHMGRASWPSLQAAVMLPLTQNHHGLQSTVGPQLQFRWKEHGDRRRSWNPSLTSL